MTKQNKNTKFSMREQYVHRGVALSYAAAYPRLAKSSISATPRRGRATPWRGLRCCMGSLRCGVGPRKYPVLLISSLFLENQPKTKENLSILQKNYKSLVSIPFFFFFFFFFFLYFFSSPLFFFTFLALQN